MDRSLRRRYSALVVVAGLVLAACGSDASETTAAEVQRSDTTTTAEGFRADSADASTDTSRLDEAEALFASTVGSNYVLVFDVVSSASAEAGSIRVTVADGIATDVAYPDAITEQILPQVPMLTVSDFFERARTVLTEGGGVEIEFDASYGYPTTMTLDPIPEAIDDEMSIIVKSVEPIEVSFENDGY